MTNNDDNPKDSTQRCVEKAPKSAVEIGAEIHEAAERALALLGEGTPAKTANPDHVHSICPGPMSYRRNPPPLPTQADAYAHLAGKMSVANSGPAEEIEEKHVLCRACGHSETYDRFLSNGCRTDFCRCGPDGGDIVTRMMKS